MRDADKILAGDLKACTLAIRNSLEEIVTKWSITINEVIQDNSFRIFDDVKFPMPSHETSFWNGRLKNLENIYDQLCDPKIRAISAILEKVDSVYFSAFRNTFKSVVESLHEARDVTLYLGPLDQYVETFQITDFDECQPTLKNLMHVVCLVWANSKYYSTNDRMVHIFRLIHNLIIDQVRNTFDCSSAFQCEVIEALNNITSILATLEYYK